MVIGETLERNRRLYPERVAITDGRKQVTYKEFVGKVYRLMNTLLDMGLAKGDRVACLLSNIPEYMELYFAVPMCGMVIVPLNYRLASEELRFIIENAGASALFVEGTFQKAIDAILPALRGVRAVVCVRGEGGNGYEDYEKLLSQHPDQRPLGLEVNEEDLANLTYTSGTTGRPKGVMLTHRNIVTQIFNVTGFSFRIHGGEKDVLMGTYPIFHVGVLVPYAGLTFGIKTVLVNFDPRRMYEIIQQERVTAWGLPPVQLEMTFNSGVDHRDYDLSSLEFLMVAGQASLLTTVKRAFEAFANRDLVYANSLGISETFTWNTLSLITRENITEVEELMATLPVKTAAVPAGLHGVYPHVDMRIVDDQGRDVEPGTVGEMIFGGDHIMKGYWKDPRATAEALKDGWYYSGDMGVWHPKRPHCSFVVDRKKEMIVSGAENVYPAEVELVLLQHPAVREAAVFGVPDPRWGETVKAAVVLKEGMTATEDELIDFCKQRIASYKKPTSVYFVTELPRNTFGKVLKGELAVMVIEGTLKSGREVQ